MAPRLLEPILAQVERMDRTIRGIRPIQAGAVLGIERHRHRGEPVTLRDGTVVRAGDRADILHFDNRRVREIAEAGWQLEGLRLCRGDLRVLAARIAREPQFDPPLAYCGASVVSALALRIGFERRPRRRTGWSALENWYSRTVMARWARDGRARIRQGRGPLEVGEVWISVRELLRRYGPEADTDQ